MWHQAALSGYATTILSQTIRLRICLVRLVVCRPPTNPFKKISSRYYFSHKIIKISILVVAGIIGSIRIIQSCRSSVTRQLSFRLENSRFCRVKKATITQFSKIMAIRYRNPSSVVAVPGRISQWHCRLRRLRLPLIAATSNSRSRE